MCFWAGWKECVPGGATAGVTAAEWGPEGTNRQKPCCVQVSLNAHSCRFISNCQVITNITVWFCHICMERSFMQIQPWKKNQVHPAVLWHWKSVSSASVTYTTSSSDNYLRRMQTCRCTWRRRAMRRSGWVAPMKNCCGVFRQGSWALACPPAPPPSIGHRRGKALLPVHTPTINDTLSGSSCIKCFLLSGIGSPSFFKLLNVPLS